MTACAGYDVGGAHLKVALIDDGRVVAVEVFPCPLWQGIDRLDECLARARPLTARAARHAVTMTGELSDLFATRQAGVQAIVDRLEAELGANACFWLGRRGFGSAVEARRAPADAGSTNFAATAKTVGGLLATALLIDMGSTTTDIIAISGGTPRILGWTDAERLTSGELVYTGLTRTSLMGVATRAPFNGRWQGLAREHLASMADVRRVLGQLDDGLDLHATADGRAKSVGESRARLARMFGRDAGEADILAWQEAARHVAGVQRDSIVEGCEQVLSAVPLARPFTVVAAGIGAGVVADVAQRLGARCVAFADAIGATRSLATLATHHAAAVAVARLLEDASPARFARPRLRL